jgi:hypothetical protein
LQLDGNTLLHHITTTQNKLILRDHVRLADDGANEGTDLDATFSFIGGDLDISPFDQSSSFTAKIAGQPVEIPVPANNLKESLPSEAVTQPIDITVPATGSLLISRSGYFSWKKTNQFFNTVSPNVTILDERTTPEQVAQAKYILARQADLDSHTGDLYQSHIELSPSTLFFDKAKQGWTFALMTPKLAPQTTGALLGQVDLTWYRPPLSIAELRNLFDKIWTKLIQQK